ncbi:hypothetical protein B0H13DRAFT_2349278 [Mycena leptocephala]|nr:hypothetical protein B0H13DRAFT_2349278 [Mycena leptocephala]
MFGFTTILSASVSLLLASQSVLAVPSPSSNIRSLRLSVRTLIAKQCETQCVQLDDTIGNATTVAAQCTSSIMSMFEACYDCEAKAGAETIETLQESVNSFVSLCADADHPVKNITVAAKSNSGERTRVAVGTVASLVVGLATMSLVAL